jgi:hypothetical protein
MKLSRAKKSIFAPVVNGFFIASLLQNRQKKRKPRQKTRLPMGLRQLRKASSLGPLNKNLGFTFVGITIGGEEFFRWKVFDRLCQN